MVPILTLIKLNTPVSWQRPFVGRVISSCCKPMVEPPYVVFILTILNINRTFFSRLAVWPWSLTRTSITVMYFLKEFILQSLESFQQRSQELLSGQPYSKEEKLDLWPFDLKNRVSLLSSESVERYLTDIVYSKTSNLTLTCDLKINLLCRNIHSLAIFKQRDQKILSGHHLFYWPTDQHVQKNKPPFYKRELKKCKPGARQQ